MGELEHQSFIKERRYFLVDKRKNPTWLIPKDERICEWCGLSYHPQRPVQKYCKKCSTDGRAFSRFKLYGITPPDQKKLLEKQGGHCALRSRSVSVIDHDHKTNRLRGFLCRKCNMSLSMIEEDVTWVDRALKYLEGDS